MTFCKLYNNGFIQIDANLKSPWHFPLTRYLKKNPSNRCWLLCNQPSNEVLIFPFLNFQQTLNPLYSLEKYTIDLAACESNGGFPWSRMFGRCFCGRSEEHSKTLSRTLWNKGHHASDLSLSPSLAHPHLLIVE